MFSKILLALPIAIAFVGAASAAVFDTVACKTSADAEAVVSSALAEPSLELGQGAKTIAMIESKFAAGACSATESLDFVVDNVDFRDAAGHIKLGVAQVGDRYAVVMTGILDF